MSKPKAKRSSAPLNEVNAWQAIQVIFKARHGICLAIDMLHNAGLVSAKTRAKLDQRLRAYGDANNLHGYYWEMTRAVQDDNRVSYVTGVLQTLRGEPVTGKLHCELCGGPCRARRD
jgi:hypothetical protein